MAAVFGGTNADKYQHFSVLDLSKDGVKSSVVLSASAIQALVDGGDSSVLHLKLSSIDSYAIATEANITTSFGNNSVGFFNGTTQVAKVTIEYV